MAELEGSLGGGVLSLGRCSSLPSTSRIMLSRVFSEQDKEMNSTCVTRLLWATSNLSERSKGLS
jgi:hypothetical protein